MQIVHIHRALFHLCAREKKEKERKKGRKKQRKRERKKERKKNFKKEIKKVEQNRIFTFDFLKCEKD